MSNLINEFTELRLEYFRRQIGRIKQLIYAGRQKIGRFERQPRVGGGSRAAVAARRRAGQRWALTGGGGVGTAVLASGEEQGCQCPSLARRFRVA